MGKWDTRLEIVKMSVLRVRDPLADGDVDVEEEVPEGVLKTPSAITAAKWDTSPVDARMNVWRDLVLRDGNVALTAAADWPKCLATTAESWAI